MNWNDISSGSNSTVKYNYSQPLVNQNFKILGIMLNAVGCLDSSDVGVIYNLQYEAAVKAFQEKKGLPATGILDKTTFNILSNNTSDKIISENDAKDDSTSPLDKQYDGSSKHTPFFNSNNSQKLRNSNLEIRVDFGANHPLNTTIKHVFLRSLGTDVDASGNPIYKVYEFIGQDVIENDVTTIN